MFVQQCDITHTTYDGIEFSFSDAACYPWNWNNGICNDECNKMECHWDGGDCNQLCNDECNIQLEFGNGNCSQACNNTECLWDFYECLPLDEVACAAYGCNVTWLNDDICDLNCNNAICQWDRGDCDADCTGNTCDEAFDYYTKLANYNSNDNLIQRDELCVAWDVIRILAAHQGIDETAEFVYGCNESFVLMDSNNDTSVDVMEIINFLGPLFQHSLANPAKAEQVDCSQCIDLEHY